MVIHRAETRGFADHGWLKSHHTFSFASYHNPERVHFGALRVLNDDEVAGGMGFGEHPHDNMEIISIPLAGALQHRDSMGNSAIIQSGEIQVMSAGTGVRHAEFNPNRNEKSKFLQIWVFPNKKNVEPRYDQITIDWQSRNEFVQILSPSTNDAGVWIHQDAWFNLAQFDADFEKNYSLHQTDNGVYVFVLRGKVKINDETLNTRDGMGIWNTKDFSVKAEENSEFILMEVPMNL
jgi:hypothetical protein